MTSLTKVLRSKVLQKTESDAIKEDVKLANSSFSQKKTEKMIDRLVKKSVSMINQGKTSHHVHL